MIGGNMGWPHKSNAGTYGTYYYYYYFFIPPPALSYNQQEWSKNTYPYETYLSAGGRRGEVEGAF